MGSIDRKHPRIAADVEIKFHLGKAVTEARTRNISSGGLCADLATALATGSDVEIEMRLMFDDNSQSDALRLPARIVWCTTFEAGFQVGVAFKPLDKKRAEYLRLFLKYLGEEKPQRSKQATNIDDRFR